MMKLWRTEKCQFYQIPTIKSWRTSGVRGNFIKGWGRNFNSLEKYIIIKLVWNTCSLSFSFRRCYSPKSNAVLSTETLKHKSSPNANSTHEKSEVSVLLKFVSFITKLKNGENSFKIGYAREPAKTNAVHTEWYAWLGQRKYKVY